MQRILVIGSGGAGKSTFSKRLGEKLHLPVVHLDSHYWKAGWVQPTQEEFAKTVEALLTDQAWIIDGNYSGTLNLRLAACDTVVFLDMPRFLCLWRIIFRSLCFHGRTRPDMAEGCPEQMTWEFIRYVWNYPSSRRPKILQCLATLNNEKEVIRLTSSSQVELFFDKLATD